MALSSSGEKQLVAVFLLVIAASVLNLISPFLIGQAIDHYIVPRDFRGLARISAIMLVVYLLAAMLTWIQQYLVAGIAQDIVLRLRNELFAKIQTLPLQFFDRQPHGELMSRITNDIENINLFYTGITQVFSGITIQGTLWPCCGSAV